MSPASPKVRPNEASDERSPGRGVASLLALPLTVPSACCAHATKRTYAALVALQARSPYNIARSVLPVRVRFRPTPCPIVTKLAAYLVPELRAVSVPSGGDGPAAEWALVGQSSARGSAPGDG